jgi:hypothetical protein
MRASTISIHQFSVVCLMVSVSRSASVENAFPNARSLTNPSIFSSGLNSRNWSLNILGFGVIEEV